MTITQLQYVLALDRYKHFGKAAKECHVTQPTLSMQLSKLEDELGMHIFDRSRNPVITTMMGERFVQQARIAVREFENAKAIAFHEEGQVSGEFKLAVIPTLMPSLVPRFLENFQKKYPDLDLVIEERKTDEIIDLLEKDKIDAGLLVTPLNMSHVIEKVLFYEKFFLYVNENHSLNKLKKITSKNLELSDAWLLQEGHCFRNQSVNLCDIPAQQRKHSIRFESGGVETLKKMVDQVGGFTFLPELAVFDLSADQKRKIRSFDGETPTREVSLVYTRSFLKKKLIEAIFAEIIDGLPEKIVRIKGDNMKVIPIY